MINPKHIMLLNKDQFINTYENQEIYVCEKKSKIGKDFIDKKYKEYRDRIVDLISKSIKHDIQAQYILGEAIASGKVEVPDGKPIETAIEWMLPQASQDKHYLEKYRIGELYLKIGDIINAAHYFYYSVPNLDSEALSDLHWEETKKKLQQAEVKQPKN